MLEDIPYWQEELEDEVRPLQSQKARKLDWISTEIGETTGLPRKKWWTEDGYAKPILFKLQSVPSKSIEFT